MNRAPPKRQKPSRFVENIHDLRAPPNGRGSGFNSVRAHVFSAYGNLYHIVFIHLSLSGSLRKTIKVFYLYDTITQKREEASNPEQRSATRQSHWCEVRTAGKLTKFSVDALSAQVSRIGVGMAESENQFSLTRVAYNVEGRKKANLSIIDRWRLRNQAESGHGA